MKLGTNVLFISFKLFFTYFDKKFIDMKTRKKTIAIFCNGDKASKKVYSRYSDEVDFIICADGGSDKIDHLNITPDVIIGDFDSISKKALDKFKDCKIVPRDNQNSTDMEKALTYAVKLKPAKILVFGAVGDRIDHTLTNLNMLKKFHQYAQIELITNKSKLFFINKPIELNEPAGTTISLVPEGLVKAVTLTGFLYPLNKDDLEFGGRDGQSNVTNSETQIIDFKKGELFIIINFR
jgi:thiamine pyrophosphokinase